jgi:hypothetical protein
MSMEVKANVFARINEYGTGNGERYLYSIHSWNDAADIGYIKVKELTFEIEPMSDKVLDTKTVEILQMKLKQVKADHYVEEQRIQTQIDDMLAIEHKPDVVDPLAWSKAAGVEEF